MLLSKQTIAANARALKDFLLSPVSPKNLRLSTTLIGIYQLLLAHVLLFFVLLGLAHVEQMKTLLAMDIEDQKDTGFIDMIPFHNELRLKSASQLVSLTEMLLYVSTVIASIYLLSAICLLAGILKNRSELVLVWLVVDFIFLVTGLVLTFWLQHEQFVEIIFGKIIYFCICFTLLFFDGLVWYIIHAYYRSLRVMNKMREIATVAIPCPAPGSAPFQFRRENMYLGSNGFGSNGYKHILSEAPDGNF